MTDYILSFDPGKSSGIAFVAFDESAVYLDDVWQVENGVIGLWDWVETNVYTVGASNTTIISEKFTPLSGGGFNQTLDSVEPLRAEGALIALGLMPDYPDPRWRRPDRQYLYGGGSLAEKKRRAHRFLKDSGFYVTGKDVGCKDANDARSAMLHGLSYLAQVVKHKPTYDLISNWTEKN